MIPKHITHVSFYAERGTLVDTLAFVTEKPGTMITSDLGDQVRKAWAALAKRHGVRITQAKMV